jgi:[acyl-carrier-protein] S-malonyltransferase
MKIAFLFPGQGAQKCGMGESFYNNDADSKQVFDNASKLLGIDMPKLCFTENADLDITEYTQAAMVTTGIAMLKAIEKTGLKAQACAGLSLGEYEALYLGKVLSEEDAIKTVRQRGILMQKEVPQGVGSMAAVLNLEAGIIEDVLKDIEDVYIANYNCPGQIVISGKKEAVTLAMEKLKEAGAKRVIELNVSGPFHSKLLNGAGEKLYTYLQDIQINEPEIPYVSNYTAEYVREAKDIRNLLRDQVSGSVKFSQSIEKMIEDGVDTFIEIGPGKTLTGFVKKINKDVNTFNIETVDDLKEVAAKLL